jgi:hypothetical protein
MELRSIESVVGALNTAGVRYLSVGGLADLEALEKIAPYKK